MTAGFLCGGETVIRKGAVEKDKVESAFKEIRGEFEAGLV